MKLLGIAVQLFGGLHVDILEDVNQWSKIYIALSLPHDVSYQQPATLKKNGTEVSMAHLNL